MVQQAAPLPASAERPAAGSRRLRVLHVVSTLRVGGMEHFVVRLAAAQRAQGHDVRILALQSGDLREQAEALGLPVKVLGGSFGCWRAARGAAYLYGLKPDVMHAHNPSSLHYAVLGRLAAGARVVLTHHGQGNGWARLPGDGEWRRTDAVVAVSAAAAAELREQFSQTRPMVIHNGIQPAAPRRSRREVREALGLGQALTGIIVARMDGKKGHDTLLRAAAGCREQGTDTVLLVVGDGSERARLENMAAGLGLDSSRVRFLGFRGDVPDLLAAADFFVLPSLTEGLPLSILEAMSHGLPTIATPVGGIPELIEPDREGILVPVNDDAALAAAIRRLARDPETRARMGRRALDRVRSCFSFDEMTSKYVELYFGLLGRIAPRERVRACSER